jgi:hypothetical protein
MYIRYSFTCLCAAMHILHSIVDCKGDYTKCCTAENSDCLTASIGEASTRLIQWLVVSLR